MTNAVTSKTSLCEMMWEKVGQMKKGPEWTDFAFEKMVEFGATVLTIIGVFLVVGLIPFDRKVEPSADSSNERRITQVEKKALRSEERPLLSDYNEPVPPSEIGAVAQLLEAEQDSVLPAIENDVPPAAEQLLEAEQDAVLPAIENDAAPAAAKPKSNRLKPDQSELVDFINLRHYGRVTERRFSNKVLDILKRRGCQVDEPALRSLCQEVEGYFPSKAWRDDVLTYRDEVIAGLQRHSQEERFIQRFSEIIKEKEMNGGGDFRAKTQALFAEYGYEYTQANIEKYFWQARRIMVTLPGFAEAWPQVP